MSSILSHLASIKARDPAARSLAEILLYPGYWAVVLHRGAHLLYRARLYLAARIVNHLSRFLTSIDIHPGAVIGRDLFIAYGFTVIGETAVIGDGVTLHPRVTLGGSNPVNGRPGKRHPTVGNGVVIGAGAQVLGPIMIGAGACIGANSVVTREVTEGGLVGGIPARPFDAESDSVRSDELERIAGLCSAIEMLRAELSRLAAAGPIPARPHVAIDKARS